MVFNPQIIRVDQIIDVYWANIDPYDDKGQFCDKGSSYLAKIFFTSEDQKKIALKSLDDLKKSYAANKVIHTKIEAAATFYPAEDYHQNYYKENPIRYKFYRSRCSRDKRLNELWGDKAGEKLGLGK